MKTRTIFLTVLCLTALLTLQAPASFGQASRQNSLAGDVQEPGTSDFAVTAISTGDLPGVLELRLSLAGTTIVNGTWTLLIQQQNSDGSSTIRGTVHGSVLSGGVILTGNEVSAVQAVRLDVEGGSDEYSGATGTGTLDATVAGEAPVQFTGNLSLEF